MGGRMSCVRTAHAEANALVQAARTGARVEGGTIYTTASPCYDCMKLIINGGISRIVCGAPYGSRYGLSGDVSELARAAGLDVVFLSEIPLETKNESAPT
jgi:deoxycytidylate deaminase